MHDFLELLKSIIGSIEIKKLKRLFFYLVAHNDGIKNYQSIIYIYKILKINVNHHEIFRILIFSGMHMDISGLSIENLFES